MSKTPTKATRATPPAHVDDEAPAPSPARSVTIRPVGNGYIVSHDGSLFETSQTIHSTAQGALAKATQLLIPTPRPARKRHRAIPAA